MAVKKCLKSGMNFLHQISNYKKKSFVPLFAHDVLKVAHHTVCVTYNIVSHTYCTVLIWAHIVLAHICANI